MQNKNIERKNIFIKLYFYFSTLLSIMHIINVNKIDYNLENVKKRKK